MKFLITMFVSVFSISVFAQGDLNSMKQDANSSIDKKMTSLRSAKDCVNNATSVERFKACKYDMHEDMKMEKMEAMEKKRSQQESED
jgi:hypothetical protein